MNSKQRFFNLLGNYPALSHYWNTEKEELDIDQVEAIRGKLSPGEVLLLNILVSIWCGNARNDFEIDITDLAAIDLHARRPIIEWLIDPFWP